MIRCIERLLQHDTAGDPMTGAKWTRRTTRKIAFALGQLGIQVCPQTVGRLLVKLGYRLRVNHKKVARTSPEGRDEQFAHIADLRERCAASSTPVISVDTKKKELIGNFKNAGATWSRSPAAVNDHDFRSDARGIAIPYGVYDVLANRGTMFVGTTYDTPAFAVDCIETWWRTEGRARYPGASEIVVLADCGGSNGPRCRAWKHGLQTRLADEHGVTVTAAHYPPGCSKWNPIEHRLFSEISKNWAGVPLRSYETMLKYIRTTTTRTGLSVRAHFVRRKYEKGVKIPDDEMRQLELNDAHPTFGCWNYSIQPRG